MFCTQYCCYVVGIYVIIICVSEVTIRMYVRMYVCTYVCIYVDTKLCGSLVYCNVMFVMKTEDVKILQEGRKGESQVTRRLQYCEWIM